MSEIECQSCHRRFDGLLMVCPHCGVERDGRSETARRLSRLLGSADIEKYRDPTGVALFLRLLVGTYLALHLAAAVVDYSYFSMIGELISETFTGTLTEVEGIESRVDLFWFYGLVVLGISGIVWLVWLYRLYANVEHLGRKRRYGLGWAIGGWFVPILSVVRPFSVTRDVWVKSSPAVTEPEPSPDEAPSVYLVWWLTWVVAEGFIFAATAQVDDSTLEGMRTVVGWWVAGDLVNVVVSVLALVVVQSLTQRQVALYENLIEARRLYRE